MDAPEFGFDRYSRERRKFSGRRSGADRRQLPDRRAAERRAEMLAVPHDRRAGADRRSGVERRAGERRSLEDRRNSAWQMLEGGWTPAS